jgi:hypothetical protein
MPKPINQDRAGQARTAVAAWAIDKEQSLGLLISELLTDLGHLCDAENIDFVERVQKALRTWSVERVDPNSVAEGPVVEIYIGSEGLPPSPKPVKRPAKPKKSRPA